MDPFCLVPSARGQLLLRWSLLCAVGAAGPLGRRELMRMLCLSERAVRKEAAELCGMGFLRKGESGFSITRQGCGILSQMAYEAGGLLGCDELAKAVGKKLCIGQVIICPVQLDDGEVQEAVLAAFGVQWLVRFIRGKSAVGVGGGGFMQKLAAAATRLDYDNAILLPLEEEDEHTAAKAVFLLAHRLGLAAWTDSGHKSGQTGRRRLLENMDLCVYSQPVNSCTSPMRLAICPRCDTRALFCAQRPTHAIIDFATAKELI